MKNLKLGSSLFAIALLIIAGLACRNLQSLGEPHTLKSKDGKFQITVPAELASTTTLSEESEIQAANRSKEIYCFVVSKKKSEYADDMTLEKMTSLVRDALIQNLTVNDSPEPEKITVNGNPAIRYRLGGVKDGVKLVYVITSIETPNHFHRVYTWTEPSRLSENEPILKQIGESFRAND